MKMKFFNVFKIFLVSLCGIGLLITVFSFPSVKNVWAQMDMEDLMESIQESIQEDVKQTTKQQVRQETTEVITENIVQPTVATTGDPTITSTTGTASCDLTGTWLQTGGGTDFDSSADDTCTCTQTGSNFSCSCAEADGHTTASLSGSLTNSSTCAYSLSFTVTHADGTCTESGTGSLTLSEDGNSFTASVTTISFSGTHSGCGDPDPDTVTFTKQ